MTDAFELLIACAARAVRAPADRLVAGGRDSPGRSPPDADLGSRLGAVADWPRFLDLAESHGLGPIVCREALGQSDALNPDVRALLGDAQRRLAVSALAAVRQLRELARVLDARGIRALAFKGPALAIEAYGDVTLRSCDDLDLVVAPTDADRAAEVLLADGYQPADNTTWAESRATHDWQAQVALRHPDGGLPVELHWRFCDRKLPWTPAVADVWARAVRRDLGGFTVVAPEPTDQVLLVVLHAARHGWDRLESVACAAALVTNGIDVAGLLGRARAVGGLRATLVGLEVARRVMGLALPAGVATAVAADAAIGRHAADAIVRLRAGDAGAGRDARLHLGLLDGAPDKVRYLALAALLPAAVDRDAVRLPRGLAPLYMPVRLARLAWRGLTRSGR